MKKSFIILSMLLLGISIKVSAQYTSIKLTAAKDTIHLGDGGSGITTQVLTFNYDTKTEAAFAQASMEVHHINPFDLPEIYVNGKFVLDVYSLNELQDYYDKYRLYGKITYEKV